MLPVRQQPGMGQAGRGSNIEVGAGEDEGDVRETDELEDADLCQDAMAQERRQSQFSD